MQVSRDELLDMYMQNLTNPSFKGVIYTCDLEHIFNTLYMNAPNIKAFTLDSISKSYYAVGFLYPNLWNERLQEIVESLVTGGIVNQYLKKFTNVYKESNFEELKSDKIILNLSHLGFGFQICFFVLYSALFVFLMEFLVCWGGTYYKNKKVQVIQPIQVVFSRLNVESPKKDKFKVDSEQNTIINEMLDQEVNSEDDTNLMDKAFGEDLSKTNKIEILLSDVETIYENYSQSVRPI